MDINWIQEKLYRKLVVFHEETDSTQTKAKEFIEAWDNIDKEIVVIADHQTGGRGTKRT